MFQTNDVVVIQIEGKLTTLHEKNRKVVSDDLQLSS